MIFIEHLLTHFVFYYGKNFNISDFISKCTFFSVNKINKSGDWIFFFQRSSKETSVSQSERRAESKGEVSYVVVSGRPGGVELHVQLSLFPGQLVVLGLFLPGQCMPLDTNTETQTEREKI